eukprot:363197-Chlamydomonas_euryale.AAC.10
MHVSHWPSTTPLTPASTSASPPAVLSASRMCPLHGFHAAELAFNFFSHLGPHNPTYVIPGNRFECEAGSLQERRCLELEPPRFVQGHRPGLESGPPLRIGNKDPTATSVLRIRGSD